MTFEDWWDKHKPRAATIRDYKLAIATWKAATSAERQRCREIALDTARIVRENPSLIGAGVAEAVAQRIGDD